MGYDEREATVIPVWNSSVDILGADPITWCCLYHQNMFVISLTLKDVSSCSKCNNDVLVMRFPSPCWGNWVLYWGFDDISNPTFIHVRQQCWASMLICVIHASFTLACQTCSTSLQYGVTRCHIHIFPSEKPVSEKPVWTYCYPDPNGLWQCQYFYVQPHRILAFYLMDSRFQVAMGYIKSATMNLSLV